MLRCLHVLWPPCSAFRSGFRPKKHLDPLPNSIEGAHGNSPPVMALDLGCLARSTLQ